MAMSGKILFSEADPAETSSIENPKQELISGSSEEYLSDLNNTQFATLSWMELQEYAAPYSEAMLQNYTMDIFYFATGGNWNI